MEKKSNISLGGTIILLALFGQKYIFGQSYILSRSSDPVKKFVRYEGTKNKELHLEHMKMLFRGFVDMDGVVLNDVLQG